jgi:hypothetical protein
MHSHAWPPRLTVVDDHSASRRVDVLEREAPHLIAPDDRHRERDAALLFVSLVLAAMVVYVIFLTLLVLVWA